ncbi:Uncharacterised protein [Vibrio cholerae]|nr:Uncharacterised protein [Vibrio cholerae]
MVTVSLGDYLAVCLNSLAIKSKCWVAKIGTKRMNCSVMLA